MLHTVSFSQLIDIPTLQNTLQHLYRAADIPSAIFSIKGTFIAGAGSQRICSEFHKKHMEAKKLCLQNDIESVEKSCRTGCETVCNCPHGLMTACCPIALDGEPVAYVFTGPFLHEPVSDSMIKRFELQAKKYGFDEVDYISATKQVPVITYEKHLEILKYLKVYCEQVVGAGFIDLTRREKGKTTTPTKDLLRLTFDAVSDGIWEWDVQTNSVMWSPQCYMMLGYNPNAFPVSYDTWKNLLHPMDRERVVSLLERALNEGVQYSCEFRIKMVTGEYLWILGRGKAIEFDTNGDIKRVIGMHTDISETKTAQEMFEKIFESSPVLMTISEISSGRFIKVNRCFEKITGYSRERAVGMRSTELGFIKKEDRNKLIRNLNGDGQITGLELNLKKADGEVFPCYYSAVLVDIGGKQHLFSLAQDLSEKKQAELRTKQLEKQLRQAQKLEAIGALSGGIAHDFNNILGVIIGFTDMVLDDVPPASRMRKDLEKVLQAGYRGKDLVGQILAFSRQSQDELVPLKLHSIIKEVLKMLRSSLPSTIKINRKIDGSCGPVEADPSQIHQVLMNLCTNAYHAMEDNGGTLTIEYRPATIIPASLHGYAEETGARFLELIISDTGIGIDDDIVDLIFDPFFTTKAKGKGTGMGLFIAYGIVQKYNGTISVESSRGNGTAFHVFLPESNRKLFELQEAQEFSAVGKEHIMFIDDEQLLVEMGKTMLERLGYTVTGLTGSKEALELFSASPDDFDLIITDQTMPEMTGLELAKAMLQKRPSLPIILCTGYSSHVDEEIAKQYGIRKLLYKPIIKSNLANLIREIFSKTPPSS
ncbi:MAG: PAS domain S-box protein [Desulforhopalus sp.]